VVHAPLLEPFGLRGAKPDLDGDGGGYAKIGRSVNEETGSKKFFAPSTVLRVDARQVSCYP
jgi:hypothetical protein